MVYAWSGSTYRVGVCAPGIRYTATVGYCIGVAQQLHRRIQQVYKSRRKDDPRAEEPEPR